jgi:hypothetical protein
MLGKLLSVGVRDVNSVLTMAQEQNMKNADLAELSAVAALIIFCLIKEIVMGGK